MIRSLRPLLACAALCPALSAFAAASGAAGDAATSARAKASGGFELDRVVAVVNDGVVLESELVIQVREITQRLTAQGVTLPADRVLREQVLERLVLEEIQAQRAERAGIRVSDEQVNTALEDIARRQNVAFAQLPEKLAESGYVYADYRDGLRREIQRQMLQARDVRQSISISPRELDQYIERQKKTISPNSEYNVSHILISAAQDSSPAELLAARQKAQDIATRLKNGESFSQLAVTYSDSQTALEGGSLGWRKGPELPTFLADVIAKLKPGETSDLLQTPTGFHLVRLNEVRSGNGSQIIEQVHLRHILIKTNEVQDDATVRQKLSDMRARILAGEDFTVLAKATSEDPGSAVQGGDLGWSKLDAYVGAFAQTAGGLKDNELSEPFKSEYGWHIVQMLGRRSFDNTDTAAREQAYQQLAESRLDEATELWLQQLRDEAFVETHL
jgi:peptidyl-prolyl cis-trans isomerase SurA